jgi:hypothetical protein
MFTTPLRRLELLATRIEALAGKAAAVPRSQWPLFACRLLPLIWKRAWRKLGRLRHPRSKNARLAFYTFLQKVFHEEPALWPGRIVFFAAELSGHRGFLDRRLHWSKAAAQGLELHLVPGDHNMMVQEPHIRQFAATLKGCLERAGEATP